MISCLIRRRLSRNESARSCRRFWIFDFVSLSPFTTTGLMATAEISSFCRFGLFKHHLCLVLSLGFFVAAGLFWTALLLLPLDFAGNPYSFRVVNQAEKLPILSAPRIEMH